MSESSAVVGTGALSELFKRLLGEGNAQLAEARRRSARAVVECASSSAALSDAVLTWKWRQFERLDRAELSAICQGMDPERGVPLLRTCASADEAIWLARIARAVLTQGAGR